VSANAHSAGWFTDPQNPTQQRYWNGSEWTEHTAPAALPTAPQTSGVTAVPPNASGATTALVLGILSLLFFGFGLLTGIPAMITARRAAREIDQSQGRLGGRGMATAGFVTGLIGTIWSALAVVLVIVVFALGSSVENEFDSVCGTINPDPVTNPECFD